MIGTKLNKGLKFFYRKKVMDEKKRKRIER